MEIIQEERIFYEAMWFSFDKSEHPIVKGYNVAKITKKLLNYIKGDSGQLEIYKFTITKRNHKVELYKKYLVLNDLEMSL